MTTEYHIRATIKGDGVTWERNVPDMGTLEPLLTDQELAEDTCKYLRAKAPETDTFMAVSGKPPLRPVYDMSRLGEKPRENVDVPTE